MEKFIPRLQTSLDKKIFCLLDICAFTSRALVRGGARALRVKEYVIKWPI